MRAPAIDPEFRDLIPRLNAEELAQLESNIVATGRAIDPLRVWRGLLLDGHNRLTICQKRGLPFDVTEVAGLVDRSAALLWIEENQLGRRNLSDDQRAAIALRVMRRRSEAVVKAKMAEAREAKAASMSVTSSDIEPPAPSPRPAAKPTTEAPPAPKAETKPAPPPKPKQDTRAAVAREAHVPERKLRAMAEIEKKDPEAVTRVARGESTIVQERAKINAQQRAEVAQRPVVIPDGKYRVIVIDPPWPMEKIERDVRPNQVGFEYPTMDEDALAKFPVRDMADGTCHIFLWTTHKFLPMALRLLEGWDFRYVCTFVWHKPGGYQPIGLPQYNCEFALYGRRGSPSFIDTKAFPVCFDAPRREHSRKPDEFYDVVRRVTTGPRIDVFSREAREGFDQHGNETTRFAA